MFAAASAAQAASELEAAALTGSLGSDELVVRLNTEVVQVVEDVLKSRSAEGDALR